MNKVLKPVAFLLLINLSFWHTCFSQEYSETQILVSLKNDSAFAFKSREDKLVCKNQSLNKIYDQYKLKSFERTFSMNNIFSFALSNVYTLSFEGNMDLLVSELRKINKAGDYFHYIERNPVVNYLYDPNDYTLLDSVFGIDYALELIHAKEGWDISKGDSNIKIGIIEYGFDTLHSDLGSNYEFLVSTGPFNLNDGHGTFAAGCIASTTDNGFGKSGIGFNCTVTCVNAEDVMVTTRLNQMIDLVVNHHVKVINCSWGFCGFNQTAQNVINLIHNYGAVIVASAGNGVNALGNNNASCGPTGNGYMYPASFNNVISVTSVGPNDNHLDSLIGNHTHNNKIDVCAPGYRILSTTSGNGFAISTGTSFSAPVVAGLCGLILSVNPCLTPDEVSLILTSTCDPVDNLPVNNPPSLIGQLGSGRVNAFNALQMASVFQSGTTPLNIDLVGDAMIDYCDTMNIYSVSYLANTNWEATNGTIVSGQNTSQIAVNWNNLLPGDTGKVKVTLTCGNTINFADSIFVTRLPLPVIPANIISGQLTVYACNSYSYFSSFTDTTTLEFVWEIFNGVLISGQGTPQVNVKWNPGISQGKVHLHLKCLGSNIFSDTLQVVIINPTLTQANKITGLDSVHACQIATYDFNPNNLPTTVFEYEWSSTNSYIQSGLGTNVISVHWRSGLINDTGTVVLSVGCNSIPFVIDTLYVRIDPAVAAGDTITGSLLCTPCDLYNYFALNTYNNGIFYSWSITNGMLLGGTGTNNVQVSWHPSVTPTQGIVEVNYKCFLDIIARDSLVVNISPLQNLSANISGKTNVLPCEKANYQLTNSPVLGPYLKTWEVINGSLSPGSQNSNLVEVVWGSVPAGSLIVHLSCNNIEIHSDTLYVSIQNPVQASYIQTALPVYACANSPFTLDYPANSLSCYWQVPNGVITSGQSTSMIIVSWDSAAFSIVPTINVTAICGTNTIFHDTLPVTFYLPGINNCSLTGDDLYFNCPVDYYSYQWSFPQGINHHFSWSVTGGQVISDSTVSFVNVKWFDWAPVHQITSSIGCNGINFYTVTKEISALEISGSLITGPEKICCRNEMQHRSYSLEFPSALNMFNYIWSVNGGYLHSSYYSTHADVSWFAPTNNTNGEIELQLKKKNSNAVCLTLKKEIDFCLNGSSFNTNHPLVYVNENRIYISKSYGLCADGIIKVTDITGRLIAEYAIVPEYTIDRKGTGIYFYQLLFENGLSFSGKLLVH